MTKTDVLIIGAGPYGIGLAHELQQSNIDFTIVGHPFSLWFRHTLDTMAIRSDWHTSEIFSRNHDFAVDRFLQTHYPDTWQDILKGRIPIDIFRSYLKDILERIQFPIQNALVSRLEQKDNVFLAKTDKGDMIEARQVVIANGIEPHRYLPDALCALPPEKIIHTWFTRQYCEIKDKKILVIGRGQSAGESVIHLLQQNNEVHWMLRKDPVFYSEPLNLPVPLFNLVLKMSPWFYYLPRSWKKKFGAQYVIPTITPDLKQTLMGDGLRRIYQDASRLELEYRNEKIYSRSLDERYDYIVAATGFKYHLDNLRFLDHKLCERIKQYEGIPDINYNFETSVPGLFAIGGISEPSYGPAQRFMMGACHSTFRLAKTLAKGV